MNDAERRVWGRLPDGTRESLAALSTSDLQTLLLSVARMRASRVRPADLLRRWREDRFVRPAPSDPRTLAALEARIWQLLPADVEGVELSPVVPLGTCSVVTPQSQDRHAAGAALPSRVRVALPPLHAGLQRPRHRLGHHRGAAADKAPPCL